MNDLLTTKTSDNLPLDQNPAAVYLASLSKGSLPAQRSALRKIAQIMGADLETMDWGAIRYQHVQFIRARLLDQYASTTANRLLTGMRRVLKEAWKLGYIPEPDYRKMVDIEPIRGSQDDTEESLTGRAISMGELTAILNACSDDSKAGIRDTAIICLGYGLGLRRAELYKMQLTDYNPDKLIIMVKSGKGNKSRILPIDNGAKQALEDWLSIRGLEPGSMFLGINRGDNVSSTGLNVKAINELFEKRVNQAKVEHTSFHDLRRSFVSDLLDQSVDVGTVAKLAGHSDPRTTLRYDRRKMETRRKAINTLHVPYTSKSKK